MSDSFSHLYAGALIRNQNSNFFLKPSYPSTLNAKKFQKCFRIRKTLLSFKPCLTVFFESHYKLFNATVFANRLFPSSPRLLYQNDVKCSAFDMEMICNSQANKTHFHKKGCSLGLILKVRVLELGGGPFH